MQEIGQRHWLQCSLFCSSLHAAQRDGAKLVATWKYTQNLSSFVLYCIVGVHLPFVVINVSKPSKLWLTCLLNFEAFSFKQKWQKRQQCDPKCSLCHFHNLSWCSNLFPLKFQPYIMDTLSEDCRIRNATRSVKTCCILQAPDPHLKAGCLSKS